MPKPSARLPQAGSAAAAEAPETSAAAPAFAPAPDNGVPFGEQTPQAAPKVPTTIKRNRRQLGARIPEELYDRLVACAEGTRIPQGRLLERALDAELQRHGF